MGIAIGFVLFALLIVAWLVLPEGRSPVRMQEGASPQVRTEDLTLTNA